MSNTLIINIIPNPVLLPLPLLLTRTRRRTGGGGDEQLLSGHGRVGDQADALAGHDVVAQGDMLVDRLHAEPGALVAHLVQVDAHRVPLLARRRVLLHGDVLVGLDVQQLQ